MTKLRQTLLNLVILTGLIYTEAGGNDIAKLVEESKEAMKSVDKNDLEELSKTVSPEKLDKLLQDKGLQDMVKHSLKVSKEAQEEAHSSIKACRTNKCQSTKNFGQTTNSATQDLAKLKDQMVVFVSSSMPKESLRLLFSQTQKIGARLVFRGLIGNSFKETQNYFRDLKINADIDPTVFEEHAVTYVPTFLVQDKTSGKKDTLKGHISLREALIKFKDHGDLKDISRDILTKLEGQA